VNLFSNTTIKSTLITRLVSSEQDEYGAPFSIDTYGKESELPIPPSIGMEIFDLAFEDPVKIIRIVLSNNYILTYLDDIVINESDFKDVVKYITEEGWYER